MRINSYGSEYQDYGLDVCTTARSGKLLPELLPNRYNY